MPFFWIQVQKKKLAREVVNNFLNSQSLMITEEQLKYVGLKVKIK
jgi:hypothetical protein